jgi:hypothetical protein
LTEFRRVAAEQQLEEHLAVEIVADGQARAAGQSIRGLIAAGVRPGKNWCCQWSGRRSSMKIASSWRAPLARRSGGGDGRNCRTAQSTAAT